MVVCVNIVRVLLPITYRYFIILEVPIPQRNNHVYHSKFVNPIYTLSLKLVVDCNSRTSRHKFSTIIQEPDQAVEQNRFLITKGKNKLKKHSNVV
jgi:hypothetical protein